MTAKHPPKARVPWRALRCMLQAECAKDLESRRISVNRVEFDHFVQSTQTIAASQTREVWLSNP